MAKDTSDINGRGPHTIENIAYIRQMLTELREVAEREGAQMLCYLIEMAYAEANDLHMLSTPSIHDARRNKAASKPVKGS